MSPPHGAIWYEVQHLKEYADNVVIITCEHTPSVAEGWNAVFQAFPDEAWGVYCARDTAWMPGSLQKLAGHMWRASNDSSIEVALMNWTYPIGGGLYNSFGLTRAAIGRFGLFDENIYPAFFEDNDFQIRQARMQPQMRVQVLPDVIMQHGKRSEQSYRSGVHTSNDPNDEQREKHMSSYWQQRVEISKAYLIRKWGCKDRDFGGCQYQLPFNKSLPVWITGPVGVVARNASGLWCI
uniref:Glycosyltransferase 2-like domain-containing protein n=2 Tax=Tetradesmus obliquus TaxID=3088 RepID=A0A383VVC8_TETOB